MHSRASFNPDSNYILYFSCINRMYNIMKWMNPNKCKHLHPIYSSTTMYSPFITLIKAYLSIMGWLDKALVQKYLLKKSNMKVYYKIVILRYYCLKSCAVAEVTCEINRTEVTLTWDTHGGDMSLGRKKCSGRLSFQL